jgi:hypothetical protein
MMVVVGADARAAHANWLRPSSARRPRQNFSGIATPTTQPEQSFPGWQRLDIGETHV